MSKLPREEYQIYHGPEYLILLDPDVSVALTVKPAYTSLLLLYLALKRLAGGHLVVVSHRARWLANEARLSMATTKRGLRMLEKIGLIHTQSADAAGLRVITILNPRDPADELRRRLRAIIDGTASLDMQHEVVEWGVFIPMNGGSSFHGTGVHSNEPCDSEQTPGTPMTYEDQSVKMSAGGVHGNEHMPYTSSCISTVNRSRTSSTPSNRAYGESEESEQEVLITSLFTEKHRKAKVDPRQVLAVFTHWKAVMQYAPRTKLTKGRVKHLADALAEGYTPEELLQVVDAAKADPFWTGGANGRGKVYDDIPNLFRNTERIDGFLRNVGRKAQVKIDNRRPDMLSVSGPGSGTRL